MFAYNFLFSVNGKRLLYAKRKIADGKVLQGVIRKEICGWKSHWKAVSNLKKIF